MVRAIKRNIIRNMNLQLFADNLNTQVTTSAGLIPEMKTYYEKRLLEMAGPNLVHQQFGDKYPIPKNGGKTIEWRRFQPLAKALTPLTEAVTPDGNTMVVDPITATIAQYGDYISQSDLLQTTTLDPIVVQATKLLGDQAGQTMDTIVREELNGGTNVLYAPKVSGGVETPVTSRAELDASAKLTLKVILKAAAILKNKNAKTIDNAYVGIVHPFTEMDIMLDPLFIDATKYGRPEDLYQGEIGMLGGVRFVRSSEAKIFYDADQGAVFSTLIIAANAYGVTELEGGGLQHIVKPLGYGQDPLNQRSAVGWKGTLVAKRLAEPYMIRIEHFTTLSDMITAAN